MKRILPSLFILLLSIAAANAQMSVVTVRGTVEVRRGVNEGWRPVQAGEVLKPEDSMKSGKKSRATVLLENKKALSLPENVIVDLSDFRPLTNDELLLKLAMERVRSLPNRERDEDFSVPQTTIMHGTEKEEIISSQVPRNIEEGLLQLNGTQVLYENGYHAGCVLRAKEVFLRYPELASKTEYRLLVASALEKTKLYGEALSEYASLAAEKLTSPERTLVEGKMKQLKRKTDASEH